MAFTKQCTAEHLFDFIEASFKLDVSSRMFGEENQFVAALDDIFRRDGAPFQVLPGITREEPGPRYVSIIRMAFPPCAWMRRPRTLKPCSRMAAYRQVHREFVEPLEQIHSRQRLEESQITGRAVITL